MQRDLDGNGSAPGRPRHGSSAWPAAFGLLLLFAVGVALGGSGRVDALGSAWSAFLRSYVNAQAILLQAREHVTPDGRSEYAVLTGDAPALAAHVAQRPGWQLRPAVLSGWQVVSTPAGASRVRDELARLPFVRAAWENRGLWLCH